MADVKRTSQLVRDRNAALVNELAASSITLERLCALAAITPQEVEAIDNRHRLHTQQVAQLQGRVNALNEMLETLNRQRDTLLPEDDLTQLTMRRAELVTAQQQASELTGALSNELSEDLRRQGQLCEIQERVNQLKAVKDKWEWLSAMLGDASGNRFREIAQSFILNDLVHRANDYLARFNNRFRLTCQPGSLLILVSDSGSKPTGTATLSGGETFMVSLALALALSQIHGAELAVDTLFIDEGFGTLSNDYLDSVTTTLSRLHEMGGRRVGIISHVEALKAHIPTQIQVNRDPTDNTRSTVSIVTR